MIVNDCYPEKQECSKEELKVVSISYQNYLFGIEQRGFDTFCANGKQIIVDTTDFYKVDMDKLVAEILEWRKKHIWKKSD